MLETLKLSKTLKSSRDDFNVLDNFNVSSIKTAIHLKKFHSRCNRRKIALYNQVIVFVHSVVFAERV